MEEKGMLWMGEGRRKTKGYLKRTELGGKMEKVEVSRGQEEDRKEDVGEWVNGLRGESLRRGREKWECERKKENGEIEGKLKKNLQE